MDVPPPPLPPPAGLESGVDWTLIDEFLALTPTERFWRNAQMSADILLLQAAWARREVGNADPVDAG